MRVVLSVAEKPSVAKELAAIISRQNVDAVKRPGISPYNPVFDIQNCLFMNSPARMIVTSVTGHLMEIEFAAAYKGWSSCQPVELFTAPISKTVKKEGENIQRTLIREAKQSTILLLWLDCDLEGENIAYEVIKVCTDANPRLDVYRARFSALVERDIYRTLKFPDRPNEKMNDAVDARQEIDLRIGAAFTRFQTLRLQKKFENVGNSVISFGPCQFPTLGFVVERSAKIKAFRPETFWCINCSHEFENPDKAGSKLSINFNWERTRVYDQYTCTVLYEMCVEGGGSAVVTQCNERPTSKQRPVPMNTIDFQMRASRLLHMSSEHAMGIAESLYQRGILSYPRTETNFFQAGIDLQGLVSDHRHHPDWGPYAAQLMDNLANPNGNNNNGAPGGTVHSLSLSLSLHLLVACS
jgi:DNA topoisomerase-3